MTRIDPEPQALTAARAALVDILGDARVRLESDRPMIWAGVASADEVAAVLQEARRRSLPVLARAPGLGSDDLTPPAGGGLLLDLSAMNRILELNHSERYAVVEPGVTWDRLERRLAEDGGDLALPTAAAPEGLAVWTSCLYDGAEGFGLARGHLRERMWGVEAVLGTGERVRTGVRVADAGWWGRGPRADLTGLFDGWRGATGVVTRLSLSLRHRRRYVRRLLIPASTRRSAIAAAIRVSRSGLFDEALVLSWSLFRLLLGVAAPSARDAGEPQAWLLIDLSADTLPELEYKRVRLGQELNRAARRGGRFDEPVALAALSRFSERLSGLRDLPLRLTFAAGAPDRVHILGAHGPTATLVDAADALEAAYGTAGLVPSVVLRPAQSAHFAVLHGVVSAPAGRLQEVHAAEGRAVDALLEVGYVPHRYPTSVEGRVEAPLDPGSRDLADRIRRLTDPDGLLDPRRWGLPAAW